MKAKKLFGWLIGTLALAGTAMGATYVDVATNYPGNIWTNGSNGGTGFEAWAISSGYNTGWAGCGIWNSTNAGLGMGEAFGYTGRGDGYINLDRSFSQALNTNDSFEFDFGINYDAGSGNRGFNLYANGIQVLNVNNAGSAALTINGSPALANYGTNAMHWIFTQAATDKIAVAATGRDGSETFSTTVTVADGYGYIGGLRFYASGVSDDFQDQRQSYFNNLTLTQEGTPPPSPDTLTFTAGTWNPPALGDYPFELTRTGAVGDEIGLTSSNTNSVMVPESVSFTAGSNAVSFNATVVSLTAGPATIIASNAATGARAEYNVTPVAPTLSIGGSGELFAPPRPAQYTLTRSLSVGDTVALSSSDEGVLSVDATATFATGETQTTFSATANALGAATITATNAASGAQAAFHVTVSAPAITLAGPAKVWTGGTPVYIVTRNSADFVGETVTLSSSDTNLMTVPATVVFAAGQKSAYFQATGVAAGTATLTADNDDVDPSALDVTVADMPGILASDEAGNYTMESFTNGANEGFGFGAWELWNTLATLGDSTAGGGGNLNSTNGYSFRFMGDGTNGYCNGKRNFDGAMQAGEVLSFTFTYNWDGGNRGVDIFSAGGQFANLIDVSPGNIFKVNQATISTEWSPGAVVEVEITQLTNGIQVYLTRATNGTVNLAYITNIVHGEAATGVSMYCGGYTSSEADNPNYAIFMNDLQIAGEERTSLTFTGGTWNPAATGDYVFELTRAGTVTDEIVLTSDNPAAVAVPASTNFATGSDTVSFIATVVSLTAGNAKIVASNVASGATAEYNVYPVVPTLSISGPFLLEALGSTNYTLTRTASVGTNILLNSSNTNVLWVPVDLVYGAGYYETTFPATALAYGTATLTASDTVSGASTTYDVTVQRPANPPIGNITFLPASGNFTFQVPDGYALGAVYGADTALVGGDWIWVALVENTDYAISGDVVTILTDAAARKIIRIQLTY